MVTRAGARLMFVYDASQERRTYMRMIRDETERRIGPTERSPTWREDQDTAQTFRYDGSGSCSGE